jgi:diacylglycerol kinase (ATP)
MNDASRDRPALRPGARIALVVNPAARQGHDRDTIDAVARALGERFAVDLVMPPSAEAVEQSVCTARTSHDAIVVAGGDGTINRAVNGLAGSTLPLGIIPMGTGNDFARACGIPVPPADAVRRILDGRTRAIDLVRVNGRVYCTVGVLGVASESALAVARLTRRGSRARAVVRRLGDWSYRAAGAWHLMRPGGVTEDVSVTASSGEVLLPSGPVHEVFVANTRILGGGLVLPVDADASDGVMEIAAVAQLSRPRLLHAFACFASGRPLPPGVLQVWRATGATITSARDVRFSADGDLMGEGRCFDVSVLPGALTLAG